MMAHKSGYTALVGLPNAGKSTLLNCLVETPLAITSHKPQTTRNAIPGIVNRPHSQIVFVDTPGLLASPEKGLNETLVEAALENARLCELVVYLCDAGRFLKKDPNLEDDIALAKTLKARMMILTKCDKVKQELRQEIETKVQKLFDLPMVWLSAQTGEGIEPFYARVEDLLPEGPALFDKEELTTVTERFVSAEFIREAILQELAEEIPYACAVTIEDFKERSDETLYIRAYVHTERDSQKGILIGAKGSMIKTIGQKARERCEAFWQTKVYLDLSVKVRPKWRRDAVWLDRFGYTHQKTKGNPA